MIIMMPPLIAHCESPVIKLPGRMLIPCRKKTKPARKSRMPIMFNVVFMDTSS